MVSPAAMARRLTLQVGEWNHSRSHAASAVSPSVTINASLACSIGARLANLPWQGRHLSVQLATGGFSKVAKR